MHVCIIIMNLHFASFLALIIVGRGGGEREMIVSTKQGRLELFPVVFIGLCICGLCCNFEAGINSLATTDRFCHHKSSDLRIYGGGYVLMLYLCFSVSFLVV